ncbi:CIC11C00000004443 [Sungouiella intermedia]|uniref:CIC11C00000004443 n=1 Tax=Sungouiella intermedia TaxID=45354 RepID=A0A1L0GGI9_9ASCO|nr:CIC11C00000004443 [[Candida] intermedia]
MHISKRDTTVVNAPHKTIVPELSVAFIGILVILLAQAICLGFIKFREWRKGDKTQSTQGRPSVQTTEGTNAHMSYLVHHNEQLPAYPLNDLPPPPYIERSEEANGGGPAVERPAVPQVERPPVAYMAS